MKKVIFFAITSLVFTGFSSFKAAPPAIITDTHTEACGPFNDFNTCNGETIITTGCYGIDVHTVVNGNKASFSLHAHGNLDATGDLGNEYNAILNQNQHQNVNLINGQANTTMVLNISFISKGSAPNMHQKIFLHISINANGNVTVTRTGDEIVCNG